MVVVCWLVVVISTFKVYLGDGSVDTSLLITTVRKLQIKLGKVTTEVHWCDSGGESGVQSPDLLLSVQVLTTRPSIRILNSIGS